MKPNEAPEKFYLLPNGFISYYRNTDEDIEYTRTNAVIEKACEYLREHIDRQLTIYHEKTWKKRDEFIEDLKKTMEDKL